MDYDIFLLLLLLLLAFVALIVAVVFSCVGGKKQELGNAAILITVILAAVFCVLECVGFCFGIGGIFFETLSLGALCLLRGMPKTKFSPENADGAEFEKERKRNFFNRAASLALCFVAALFFASLAANGSLSLVTDRVDRDILVLAMSVPGILLLVQVWSIQTRLSKNKPYYGKELRGILIAALVVTLVAFLFSAGDLFRGSVSANGALRVILMLLAAGALVAALVLWQKNLAQKKIPVPHNGVQTEEELSDEQKKELSEIERVKATYGEAALFQKGNSKFDGGIFGRFWTNLWTGFVTLITLSIALPWMTCAKERWFAKHTIIDGRRLQFKGKGAWLIGSYIKWLLLSLVTCGIFALWIPVKLEKWRVKYTVFFGTEQNPQTSAFEGGLLGLIGVNLGVFFGTVFSIGLARTWLICFKQRWFGKYTLIEGHRQGFNGRGGDLFVKNLLWTLLTLVTCGIYGLWRGQNMTKWVVKNTEFIDVFPQQNMQSGQWGNNPQYYAPPQGYGQSGQYQNTPPQPPQGQYYPPQGYGQTSQGEGQNNGQYQNAPQQNPQGQYYPPQGYGQTDRVGGQNDERDQVAPPRNPQVDPPQNKDAAEKGESGK